MSVQKAVVFNEIGPASALTVVNDFPVPARQPGEVMVKVVSTSVNPIDYKIREPGPYAPTAFPKVPGADIAGIVQEADEGSKFKAGDKVFAMTNTAMGQIPYGTYLEYFPAKEDWLAPVPDNLPLEEAGGVPVAALTAWQALDPPSLQPGQRVLVLAAAGGVGHVGVQIAKAFGTTVVGTAGPTNQEFVKGLGADEVYNYRSSTVDDAAANGEFDVVLDLIGGEEGKQAYMHVNPDGRFAHVYNTGSDPAWLSEIQDNYNNGKGPSVTTTAAAPNGEQLGKVGELIAEGKVKLVVQLSYPLEQAEEAHTFLKKGTGIQGKVVLRP